MNITALPFEILLHIFVIGCDEPDGPQESVDSDKLEMAWSSARVYLHPRRRKRFAALLRKVCVSWRNIIEDPPNTRSQFHIVRVGLDWSDSPFLLPSPIALVRQLS